MVPRRGIREGSTESVGAWADASWIPVSAAITIPIPTLKPLDLVIAIVLGSQSGRKPTRCYGATSSTRRFSARPADQPVQISRNNGRFRRRFCPCICRNPRSAAKDVLKADAYLQCSLRNGFSMLRIAFAFSAALAMFACFSSQADAAQCGSSSAGFAAWKQEFSGEARAKGIGASAIQALMATNYAQTTINADRGQRSFNLSLDQFLSMPGATNILSRGSLL